MSEGKILKPTEISHLVQLLKDPSSFKRSQAAEHLGSFTVREALPDLIPLLNDSDDVVRSSATFAVSVIADSIWEILPEYYALNNANIINEQKFIKEVVIPKLIELLNDPFSEVRVWAINGLNDLGVKHHFPQ